MKFGPHVWGLFVLALPACRAEYDYQAPLVSISPSAPTTEDDLVATASCYNCTYRWFKAEGTQTDLSPSFTVSTVPASSTTRGETWRVVVTDSNEGMEGPPGEAEVVVQNAVPVVTVTLVPQSVYTDEVLTAVVETSDVDGDEVIVSYTWRVDQAVVKEETGSSLAGVDHFEKGQEVYVEVVPSDGIDNGVLVWSAVLTVANTAPSDPVVSLGPGSPVQGVDPLLCVVSGATDLDGDDVTYLFQWDVDGENYDNVDTTNHPGDTVPGSETLAGEQWTCAVTALDGEDSSASVLSNSVTILPADYLGWTDVTPHGGSFPPGVYQGAMAYDYNTGKVVHFGGMTDAITDSDETWVWDSGSRIEATFLVSISAKRPGMSWASKR